mmetsp:Transcript_28045/g.70042  ORF Transcript_28045/g.70042 Transcript_28045/m.70042 type:complete len:155 (+) Transcript_28045:294-758(+)
MLSDIQTDRQTLKDARSATAGSLASSSPARCDPSARLSIPPFLCVCVNGIRFVRPSYKQDARTYSRTQNHKKAFVVWLAGWLNRRTDERKGKTPTVMIDQSINSQPHTQRNRGWMDGSIDEGAPHTDGWQAADGHFSIAVCACVAGQLAGWLAG